MNQINLVSESRVELKYNLKCHKNLNQRIEGMSELACRVEF